MGVPDFPLSVAGTWMPLDVEGRRQWLSSASRHYFEGGGHRELVVRPAGAVVVLDASQVTDLEGFLCALGEAVNGPGGYFGLSLRALEDCLIGGFGMTRPWTLQIVGTTHLTAALDGPALIRWAEQRLAAGDSLDETGRAWIVRSTQPSEETLWGHVLELFDALGVSVIQRP